MAFSALVAMFAARLGEKCIEERIASGMNLHAGLCTVVVGRQNDNKCELVLARGPKKIIPASGHDSYGSIPLHFRAFAYRNRRSIL